MFRDLLSSRLIQAGLVFFVFVVGGSLLYSWHAHRATESDLGTTPQTVVSLLENTPTTKTVPIVFQDDGVMNTPDETMDIQKSEASEVLPNETDDIADAFLPEDFVSEEEAPAEDVPVSPYGFGPYPEVPETFIKKVGRPSWFRDKRSNLPEGTKRGVEIIERVLIGLWKQGDEDIINGFHDPITGRVG